MPRLCGWEARMPNTAVLVAPSSSAEAPTPLVQPLLTKSQTAQVLCSSVRSVESWISGGLLKTTRLGGPRGLIRIDPEDLRDFIQRAKRAQVESSRGT